MSVFIDGVPRDLQNYFRDSPVEDIFENTVLSARAWMARGAINYLFIILIKIVSPKPKPQIYNEHIYEQDADGKILI